VDVPRHSVGNWEGKTNYLTDFQYAPPGKSASKVILNSCSNKDISATLQCTGHGRCRGWHDVMPGAAAGVQSLSFCECHRDWADPECNTPRKSQISAFVLSLFFGMFGADQFYLGFPWYGIAKLATLGGAGIWYLYDLCRIGSSPVLTQYSFRVAADLPHFAFVLTVVTAMLFFGFFIAIYSIHQQRIKKAHELLLLSLDHEEAQKEENIMSRPKERAYSMKGPTTLPSFYGYGGTIQSNMPLNSVPLASGRPPMTLPPVIMPMVQPVTLPPMTMPPMTSSVSVLPAVQGHQQVPVMTLPPVEFARSAPAAGPVELIMPPTVTLPPVQFARSAPVELIMPPTVTLPPVEFARSAPIVRPVRSSIDTSQLAFVGTI